MSMKGHHVGRREAALMEHIAGAGFLVTHFCAVGPTLPLCLGDRF
jgi:hypothetical protein